MAAKSANYTCRARVRHDGRLYPPGGTVTLTPVQAAALLALGAVVPAQDVKPSGAGG